MSNKIKYYHESSLYRSPDPSDLPNPYTLFKNFNNNKMNTRVKNSKEEYNKKATEELKKLLGIK